MDFLRKIIKESMPSPTEKKRIRKVTAQVIARIEAALSENKIKAHIMLGGSAAKETYLHGDFDCDCFVRFDKKYTGESLSNLLSDVLSGLFEDIDRVPGSRDYFQFDYKGMDFEIVPVLDITDHKQVENVTDASPLHVGWITDHLERSPKLREEILLTKQFFKANDLYGAESYIRGFSGHVVDLLIIHYRSFMKLIAAASEWKPTVVIDAEGHHKDAIKAISKQKHGPLIIVDPIQPERNAAAALSLEQFKSFVKLARLYREKPSKKLFLKKELSRSQLERMARGKKLLMLKATPRAQKRDVMGAKMLKVYRYIRRRLKEENFQLIDSSWRFSYRKKGESEGFFWFIVDKRPLPQTYEHPGPPSSAGEHAKVFKKKHNKVEIHDGRLYATVKRQHRSADQLLREMIREKEEYLFTRVQSLSMTVRAP